MKPYIAKKGSHPSDDPSMYIDVRKSILELRKIYKNLTDVEFAAMYEKRYRIKKMTVIRVLDEAGASTDGRTDSKK